jgi:hypothetical protein
MQVVCNVDGSIILMADAPSQAALGALVQRFEAAIEAAGLPVVPRSTMEGFHLTIGTTNSSYPMQVPLCCWCCCVATAVVSVLWLSWRCRCGAAVLLLYCRCCRGGGPCRCCRGVVVLLLSWWWCCRGGAIVPLLPCRCCLVGAVTSLLSRRCCCAAAVVAAVVVVVVLSCTVS